MDAEPGCIFLPGPKDQAEPICTHNRPISCAQKECVGTHTICSLWLVKSLPRLCCPPKNGKPRRKTSKTRNRGRTSLAHYLCDSLVSIKNTFVYYTFVYSQTAIGTSKSTMQYPMSIQSHPLGKSQLPEDFQTSDLFPGGIPSSSEPFGVHCEF